MRRPNVNKIITEEEESTATRRSVPICILSGWIHGNPFRRPQRYARITSVCLCGLFLSRVVLDRSRRPPGKRAVKRHPSTGCPFPEKKQKHTNTKRPLCSLGVNPRRVPHTKTNWWVYARAASGPDAIHRGRRHERRVIGYGSRFWLSLKWQSIFWKTRSFHTGSGAPLLSLMSPPAGEIAVSAQRHRYMWYAGPIRRARRTTH